jgi:preprotein translocase subunit SecD
VVNLWYGRKKKLQSIAIGTIWRPDNATGGKVATRPDTK